MRVTVKLFAAARQLAGVEAVEVEVLEPPTVAGLRTAMIAQYPALAAILKRTLFAVNAEYAADSTPLQPNSEVACIPPVSGG